MYLEKSELPVQFRGRKLLKGGGAKGDKYTLSIEYNLYFLFYAAALFTSGGERVTKIR